LRPKLRAFIASVLVCGAGLAEPIERGSYRMVWKGPAECPTDLEVLARIEALLGTRVSELELPPLAARGRITLLAPENYELVLETFQGEQRFLRTMKAASCGELTDAGALVLALAIDPTLSERRTSAATAPAPSASATPNDSPPAPARATPARPRERRTPAPPPTPAPEPVPEPEHAARFLLGARAVLDFGSVADIAVGPGIGLAIQWRAFEGSLDGVWLPARRTLAAPGKGGDIALAAVALRGCYRPLSGVFQALGCASFELGSLDGNGVGTVVRTHRSGLWAAPGALVGGRARLGSRLLVSLGAGAMVPIKPIDFTLDNVGLVHRVPALVARVEAGLQAHFD
jgi:hypothetical protein